MGVKVYSPSAPGGGVRWQFRRQLSCVAGNKGHAPLSNLGETGRIGGCGRQRRTPNSEVIIRARALIAWRIFIAETISRFLLYAKQQQQQQQQREGMGCRGSGGGGGGGG